MKNYLPHCTFRRRKDSLNAGAWLWLILVFIFATCFQSTAKDNSYDFPKEYKHLSANETVRFVDIKIQGIVKSEKGEPLAGVTIKIKGSNTGMVTNEAGKFTMEVPDNSVLIISFIGYETREIPVNGKTNFNITLTASASGLGEVVVVGYGTQKKSDFTGSVQRVHAEQYETQPLTDMTEMLNGTVAGLSSNQGTTASGGGDLEIRGPTSLAANNSPLIVLDGVIYTGRISDINPADIETIDILKDASSAAIFGSRASSGILLVTTKKGRTSKPVINFSSKIGIEGLTYHMKPFGPEGYLKARGDLFRRLHSNKPKDYYTNPDKLPNDISVDEWMNYDQTPTGDPVGMWLNRLVVSPIEQENYLAGKVMNWYDAIYQNGVRQDYDVSITGGTSNLRYYLSSGYTDNKGYSLGDEYKTFRSRVNIDADMTDFLKVGVNAQFADANKGFNRISLQSAIVQSPYTQPYDSSGNLVFYPNGDLLVTNPFIYYKNREIYNRTQNLFAILFAELKLPFGFSYRINFSNNYSWNKSYLFDPHTTPRGRDNGGYGERKNSDIHNWMVDNIIKWNRTFSGIHKFDFTFLFNAEKNQNWYNRQSSSQIEPTDALSFHALQAGNNPSITDDDEYSTGNALMARLNYTLLDKYLVTASWRRDGYSAFGQDNPYAQFPAAAIGWRISKENFFKINWISDLKLRVSWGVNGNRTLEPYDALARLSVIKYLYGNTLSSGVYSSKMANSQLRWERTEAFNIGVDFGLFENKLTGNAEVYTMTTTDLLLNRSLPEISGYSNVAANLGELGNKGFELTLNSTNIHKKNITWQSSLVFSFNRNKIKHLYGEMVDVTDSDGKIIGQKEADDLSNSWFIGKSIDRIWGYEVLGVWQSDEADKAAVYGKEPGDMKLRDVNNDGAYVPKDDKTFQGYKKPQYRLGIRNDILFLENFELSVFVRADLGFYGVNNLYKNDATGGQFERENTYAVPYWTPDNQNNEWARLNSDVSSPSFSVWKRRSFVRIQDVSLSYNFSHKIIDRLNLKNLKLYINLRNYFTFTKWTYWDPESGGTPMPKYFTFGLDVGL